MSKAQAHLREARKVAAFLDGIGEHKRANDVRAVCRSNDTYRGTLGLLHTDNLQLRAALKFYGDEASWAPAAHPQIDANSAPIVIDGGRRAREVLARV